MTSSDTLFATTRLTLGLSRLSSRATIPTPLSTGPDDVLDRRKRKRDDESHYSREGTWLYCLEFLTLGTILTPGSTPLLEPTTIDPPLLAFRYLPISIAGDGAFSRTILAHDLLDPRRPTVAIKAMKPGFEAIGQQVENLWRAFLMEGIQPVETDTELIHAETY